MKPDSLSPSQLSVWLNCERQWHYAYRRNLSENRPKAIYFDKGNYVHELFHYYYSFIKAGYGVGDPVIIDAITTRIKEDLEEQGEVDWVFYKEVVSIVINYIQKRSPVIDTGIKINNIEWDFGVEANGRKFHGIVDLIFERNGDKVPTIRDHKTGAQNRFSYGRQDMDMQMLFYGTLFYKKFNVCPKIEINWVHSKPPKNPKATILWDLITIVHTPSMYERFWEYLLQINEDQDNPQTRQNLSHCKGCAFNSLCRAGLRDVNSDFLIGTKYVERTPKPKATDRSIPQKDSLTPTPDQETNGGNSGGPLNFDWG